MGMSGVCVCARARAHAAGGSHVAVFFFIGDALKDLVQVFFFCRDDYFEAVECQPLLEIRLTHCRLSAKQTWHIHHTPNEGSFNFF